MHLFILTLISAASASSLFPRACSNPAPKFTAAFAPGYSGKVVINGLQSPRGLVFDSLGNALIVEKGVGVRFITLSGDSGTIACAASSKQLISNSDLNHGIAMSANGKTLLVSSADKVYAFPYFASNGTVGSVKILVAGMSNSDHTTRTLFRSNIQPDALLVSRGSSENNDAGSAQVNSGRAQIRLFNLLSISRSPGEYITGKVFGWGLRNSVGIAEHPKTGGIWSVENSVDNLVRAGVDIHNTNPCEELNYHGTLSARSRETGANYGYPTCFTAFNRTGMPQNSKLQTGVPFATNPADDAKCQANTLAPRLCFPAHNAPLGVTFNKAGSKAFVAFHGSWNRNPPDGYRVSAVEFNANTGMPTAASTSTSAATQIMYNPDLSKCSSGGCFRPVDLAWDNKNRLFMTSDATGELWVIGVPS